MSVKLTQYSHGAGCGCKISPAILSQMLSGNIAYPDDKRLIVGNSSRDDAAVFDIGDGRAVISTTDFFMPIVDDPFTFGKIASANAISDVYAMGGRPIMAIAILGWPIDKLGPEIAALVIQGARAACAEAGIVLAGGHSIDAPEPMFGLAVNGIVDIANIKQNNTAKAGDQLFLTKPLGVGILTTAEKKGILLPEHALLAPDQMMQLNKIGALLGGLPYVHALTDVTGFGLLGHLTEMCEGSNLSAIVQLSKVPLITPDLPDYIAQKSIPGGTHRNWASYGEGIQIGEGIDVEYAKAILADPQTSGGLLIACAEENVGELIHLFSSYELQEYVQPIGQMMGKESYTIKVNT
jgi:selenide, water dikinase